MAAIRPRWVFLVFLFSCVTFFEVLETVHVPLGFMKLYVQDVVFAFNVGLILARSSIGKTRVRAIRFNRYVMLFFLLGVWGTVNGLFVARNPYDEVLGDFRRAFFYFMNYFVALFLVDDLRDTRILRRVLLAATLFLVAKGWLQMATGQFYYRRFGDAAHILTHIELTFLSFAVFYGLSQIVFNPAGQRLLWFAAVAGGTVTTVVGNYRASWLGLVGGVFFMFFFLSQRKRVQLTGIAALGAVIVGLSIFAMWDVQVLEHSTLGEEIAAKANVGTTTEDINVTWRFASYKAAVKKWQTRPVLGTGLGTYLEFDAPTSTGGTMLAEGHSIHNSLLWLLMVQGVAGFVLIMAMHVAYLRISVNYLRTTNWTEGKVTVLACAAYYCSMMISTVFEHFLESAMSITVFSSIAALTMLTIYYTPRETETTSLT